MQPSHTWPANEPLGRPLAPGPCIRSGFGASSSWIASSPARRKRPAAIEIIGRMLGAGEGTDVAGFTDHRRIVSKYISAKPLPSHPSVGLKSLPSRAWRGQKKPWETRCP